MLQFLGGSFAALALIVGLAAALGFRAKRQIAGEVDFSQLGAPYGGTRQIAIDAAGTGALALLGDGRLLVVRAVGSQLATRVVPLSAIAALQVRPVPKRSGIAVTVRLKDFGFPAVRLRIAGNTLPDWINELQHGARAR